MRQLLDEVDVDGERRQEDHRVDDVLLDQLHPEVDLLEPHKCHVKHVHVFGFGQVERIVVAAHDQRVPFVVLEGVCGRVRVVGFDAAECVRCRVCLICVIAKVT